MGLPLKPVVFACSGCSPAGQLANQLALELDRRDIAEMSCLARPWRGKARLYEAGGASAHVGHRRLSH